MVYVTVSIGCVWNTQAARIKKSYRGHGLSKILDQTACDYIKRCTENPIILSVTIPVFNNEDESNVYSKGSSTRKVLHSHPCASGLRPHYFLK